MVPKPPDREALKKRDKSPQKSVSKKTLNPGMGIVEAPRPSCTELPALTKKTFSAPCSEKSLDVQLHLVLMVIYGTEPVMHKGSIISKRSVLAPAPLLPATRLGYKYTRHSIHAPVPSLVPMASTVMDSALLCPAFLVLSRFLFLSDLLLFKEPYFPPTDGY